MIYRKLTEDGDMTLGNKQAYISDIDAVKQAVITRLRQLIYEWWEQIEDGVPYWQQIIAQRDIQTAEKLIRERIARTDHVVSILSFDPTWDNEKRHLTIACAIQSDYGPFTLEGVMF
jgi:hypothetical protein